MDPDSPAPSAVSEPQPVASAPAPIDSSSTVETPAPGESLTADTPATVEVPAQAEEPTTIDMYPDSTSATDASVDAQPVSVPTITTSASVEPSSTATVSIAIPPELFVSATIPIAKPPTALGSKASAIDTSTLIRLGHEARRHKKEHKLERIMSEITHKGRISARDAAIAAEISLRTAETYLNELASAGRLSKHLAGNATEYNLVR